MCNVEVKNKKRIYCSNDCKFADKEYNKSRISSNKNTNKFELICKLCEWKTLDEYNKSGSITKHLLTHNIEFMDNSYSQHFNFIKYIKPLKLKCPICNWESSDYLNKSGIFTTHIVNVHNLSVDVFLSKYNNFNYLWKTAQKQNNLNIFLETDDENRIKCIICNKNFRKLTNKHLNTHGITPTEYKEKYGLVTTCSVTTENLQRKKSFVVQINNVFDRISAHDCSPLFTKDEYTGVKDNKQYNFECDICKNKFKDTLDNGKFPLCRVCNPRLLFHPNKKFENEFFEFLQSIVTEHIISNDRKIIYPKEVDFYIPELNVAIELDGLYWHSEIYKTNKYHIEKTTSLKNKGIRTIHIFEDEWKNQNGLVKTKLTHILKKATSEKIYARNCIIQEIASNECCKFLNLYHIQGSDTSYLKLGLFYNDILMSVMTFSKPRVALGNSGKEDFIELSRFASNSNYIIVGSASKLFSHFIKNYNPKRVISYADLRWTDFNKNVYSSLGFTRTNQTNPNYFWCKNNNRHHRYMFNKQKLIKLGYDSNKTEVEIMNELGYYRIWDCGHLKYEWNN